MCDRGRTITHMQIPRFHTQVWYKISYPEVETGLANLLNKWGHGESVPYISNYRR